MNLNTKKSIVALALATAVFPSLTFARDGGSDATNQTTSDTQTSVSGQSTATGSNFCTNISNFATKIQKQVADLNKQLDQDKNKMAQDVDKDKHDQQGQLNSERDHANQLRGADFTKLEQRAQTDAQKQAVQVFETAVNAAVAARRTAIDKALADFKTAFDSVFQQRQTNLDAARNAMIAALNAALQKAQTDCTAGVDPSTVRQNFSTALKTAQQNFVNSRKSLDKAGPQVKALEKNRNTAIQKANSDFNAALKAATAQLKLAFPKPDHATTTPTTSPANPQQNNESESGHQPDLNSKASCLRKNINQKIAEKAIF